MARYAKKVQALEAAGRAADAATGRKRSRMTGVLALFIARITGLDGALTAYRAWKDERRHRRHDRALEALRVRQDSELVALRAQYQELKRRRRRRGEGKGRSHDKAREQDFQPGVRDRPERRPDPGPEH